MNYDEVLKYIKGNFRKKIQTQDKILQIKIFNNLFNWYRDNFEENLKQAVEKNNQLGIISILKEIEKVCNLSDYEKMQLVYMDDSLKELIEISTTVFEMVKQFIKNDKKEIDLEELEAITKKIDQLEQNVSEIKRKKFIEEKSECLLDIEFLKNNGKVDNYSIRTYRIISDN